MKIIREPYSGETTVIKDEETLIYSDDPYDYKYISIYDNETDDWIEKKPEDCTIDELNDFAVCNSQNLEYDLEDIFPDGLLVVSGYFGGWQGHQAGGLVSNKSLYDIVCDLCVNSASSSVSIYQKTNTNTLVVYNRHHDGCSRYEIKLLNTDGEQFYYDNVGALSRQELVETLFNSNKYICIN